MTVSMPCSRALVTSVPITSSASQPDTTVFFTRNAARRFSIWLSARSKSCCIASSSFSRVDLYSGYISVRPESQASLIQMR